LKKILRPLDSRKTQHFACEVIALAIFLNLLSGNSAALFIDSDSAVAKKNLCSTVSQKNVPDDSDQTAIHCFLCLINERSDGKGKVPEETLAITFESKFISSRLNDPRLSLPPGYAFRSRAPPRII